MQHKLVTSFLEATGVIEYNMTNNYNKANADEIIREQCRAREDAKRIQRTLERDLMLVTQEKTALLEDNALLKEDNASLKEDIAFLKARLLKAEAMLQAQTSLSTDNNN